MREATGLKANHVCQAIRRVIGNAEGLSESIGSNQHRLAWMCGLFDTIEELQTVGVTLMCGRVKFKLSIGNYELALLKGRSSGVIGYTQPKREGATTTSISVLICPLNPLVKPQK